MKFDTRDKKPKLYALLILTVIIAAAVAGVRLWGGENCAVAVCVLLDFYFAAAIVLLLFAFVGQIHYNPYSYNTILYAGFALFVLSVLITQVRLTVRMLRFPGQMQTADILRLLAGSARTYIFLTLPFLAVFSVALCISNISLIRHEGKRLVNVLGILLSFLILGGWLLLFRLNYAVSGSLREVMLRDLITNLFATAYLYFECMLIGAIAADLIAAVYEPEPDKDYLIILGLH